MRNRLLLVVAASCCFTVLSVVVVFATALAAESEVWVSAEYNQDTEGWGVTRFSVIQDAVDAVAGDGTVIVGAGTYYENVTIGKDITLQATDPAGNAPVVNGGGSGDVISLISDGITVRGLGLVNGDTGIGVHSNGNTITQCQLMDNQWRIMVRGSQNTITGNTLIGKGEGIALYDGARNNVIKDNTIIGDSPGGYGCTGIRLVYSPYNEVANNKIEMFRVHILLQGSDHNVISNNAVLKSWESSYPGTAEDHAGIALYASDHNTVINNDISATAASGIRLLGASSNNTLKANIINNINHAGIDLYYGSKNNSIINNDVTGSGYGIILDHASENVLSRNIFRNNWQNAFNNSSNAWSEDGIGNYWGDYEGPDVTGDDIGELSYNILPTGKDNAPLREVPNIQTEDAPAIKQALSKETDDAPLEITTEEVWDTENRIVEQRVEIKDGGRLTITGSTVALMNTIVVRGNGSLAIENSELQVKVESFVFIDMSSEGSLRIVNSVIDGKGQTIVVHNASELHIEGCEFNRLGGWSAGIEVFAENAGITIKDNALRGSYGAVSLQSVQGYSITGNTFADSLSGITSFSAEGNITNNTFSNMVNSGFIAVGTSSSTVSGNEFADIWGPAVAILPASLEDRSKGNLLYENSFINCSVYDEEKNQWYYQGRGNYWNDYSEKHSEASQHPQHQGVWNTPYLIHGHDQDNFDLYPLMAEADIPSSWAGAEIERAREYRLTTDRVVRAYQTDITREEFCELAVNLYEALSGEDAQPISPNPFTDTDNPEILKANQLGIVNGTGGGLFAPNDPITRQELAVMLLRTLQAARPEWDLDTSGAVSFSDEREIAFWAVDAVGFANRHEIMRGVGGNRIDPEGKTTREQAIIMVTRMYGIFAE